MRTPRNILRNVFESLKLISVEPYLFFCFFGHVIRLVSFQSLLMDRACRNLHLFSDDICNSIDDYKHEQSASMETGNNLYAGVMLLSSLPAIVVAIFLGPWSDKYSRKYPMLISATGMLLESIASAIITAYPTISPVWYAISALFAGLFGGFIMSMSSSFSYMSDVTDERSRPARFAMLEFANILAIILGSVLGGEIFRLGGYLPVMIVSPCSFGIAILYTIFVVKETKVRTPEQTPLVMIKDLVTFDNIKESYKTCSKRRPGNIRLQIWLLVLVSCSQKFVDMGTISIGYPYAKFMYKWDVTKFSHASTYFYMVNAFMTIAIIPILSNKLRLHEAALGLIGMLSLTSKMVVTSVSFQEPLFYYAWLCGFMRNCTGIAIRSRLSKLVSKRELGRAFSLLGTCESVTPLIGTLAFVQMYNASALLYPGLPFAVSAVLLIPSLIIFTWMIRLPTISLGEYARDTSTEVKAIEPFPSNYMQLEEEKF